MRALLLTWVALAAAACGTTRIVAGHPEAAIYIDGAFAGHGRADLRRRGLPTSVEIEVRFPDGATARRVVARRFTAVTVVAALLSYGLGLLVWELPGEIAVAAPPPGSGWDITVAEDPWLRPPSGALQSSAW